MGREIRMVPPNWRHPEAEDRYGRMRPQPMHDRHYDDARREWMEGLLAWERGDKPDYTTSEEWWDYAGPPPDRAEYRPWRDEEATWFQVWETVSEGTPVTPPFASKQELAGYLAEHGDFWDQQRCREPDWQSLWGGSPGKSGWGKERADRFVHGPGWAPSMIISFDSTGKTAVLTNPGDMVAG